MWYQIKTYIQFLLKSKNHHSVHSPFVYDLITKCFYDKQKLPEYSKLKAYRKALIKDKNYIHITDFGSGSKVFSSNKRTIKQIAKTSGTTLKRAKLLHRLVSYLSAKHILEMGTSLGIGTYALALANPEAKIISIEGCPELSNFTSKKLQEHQITNVDLKIGTFSEVLPHLNQTRWDIVFLDGHHEKNATLKYFNQLLTTAHNNSVCVLDDIHWSKDMTEAWAMIKKHPQVTVTIDTFFWGFVFFRKEQAKENFTIRL